MRSRLISVLQQSVQRSQKFADYNFRNYFVAKYATKLEQVETEKFGPITEEILKKAEADLEMLIRQTTIQENDHFDWRFNHYVYSVTCNMCYSDFTLKSVPSESKKWFDKKQLYNVEPTVVEHQKQNL